MSDVALAVAPEATPAPAPMGNDPTARTETGEIKDVQATPASDPAAKPAEAKPADALTAAEKTEVVPGAPEKYADFKVPEGLTLDPKILEQVGPLFKELGLTQEQAQKLVDFQAKHEGEAQAAADKVMTDMRAEWRGEVVKDPALGNGTDGLKPEVQANITKAVEAIGDAKGIAAFKEAMNLTGAGDNPALIRGLNAMGKLLSEGTLVRGGGPSAAGQSAPGAANRPSPAQAMYPSLPSSAQS